MDLIIDLKNDSYLEAKQMLDRCYNGSETKKHVCSKCGKEVDQKVVNYCKVQFKGKTLCRDCQKEESG